MEEGDIFGREAVCFDEPDGQVHYWGDKRLPKDIFSKRVRGGGGILVRGAISWYGKSELVMVTETLDAVAYMDMLEAYLMPFILEHYLKGCVIQQDGAPAHRAKLTRDFSLSTGMADMEWPPKSPDLNCIENLWGFLIQKVYEKGRQYDCDENLREALFYAWDEITLADIRKLIASMPNRAHECLTKRGRITSYY